MGPLWFGYLIISVYICTQIEVIDAMRILLADVSCCALMTLKIVVYQPAKN